jgi:D-threo-aldose 1-dehydrogenase
MKAIDKRALGRAGMEVSVLGMGGAPLGDLYELVGDARARETIETAYGLGIRLFDTAPLYGRGLSETRIGAALRDRLGDRPGGRNDIVLSTKVGRYLVPPGAEGIDHGIFKGGLDYEIVMDYGYDGTMRALEQSLGRLGVSHIDIVHIHDVDRGCAGSEDEYQRRFRASSEGAYKALDELRSAGAIGAIGVGVNEVAPLLDFAGAGTYDCFMLAGRYTLLEQEALDALLPLCIERDIAIMIAGPFNSGILATGARPGAMYNYAPAPPPILDTVARIEAVCARHAVPLAAVALQFPLAHPAVRVTVPGASTPQEVAMNARLLETAIPRDLWAELKHERLLREDAPTP